MKDFPLIFSAPMVQANHKGIKRMTRRVVDMNRLKVVMRREVRSDLPAFIRPPLVAPKGAKLSATLNQHGAVSCLIDGRELGLKPGEFDFVCPYAQGETVLVREGGKHTWTIIPHESRVWVRETWRIGAWEENTTLSIICPDYKFAIDYAASPELKKTPWFYVDNETGRDFTHRTLMELHRKGVESDEYGHFHWPYGEAPLSWRPSIHMPRWACRDVYTVIKVRLERLQNISEADAIAEGVEPVGRDPEGERLYRNYFDDGYAWSAEESFMTLWHTLHGFKGPNAWDRNPLVWVIEYDNPLWKGSL